MDRGLRRVPLTPVKERTPAVVCDVAVLDGPLLSSPYSYHFRPSLHVFMAPCGPLELYDIGALRFQA